MGKTADAFERLRHWIMKQNNLLPIVRIAISASLLCFLMPMMREVFIDPVGIAIPARVLTSILFVGYVLNLYFILTETHSRGWIYDIACALFAPELVLYLKWMEDSFGFAVIVLGALLIILMALWVSARRWMLFAMKKNWLPLVLIHEMLDEIRRERSACHVFYGWAALIITSVMLLAPSILSYRTLMSVEYNDLSVHESVYEKRMKLYDKNEETIALLEQEKWRILSDREKRQVLQTAADIEAQCLGIGEVSVEVRPMESIAGSYNESGRLVKVDLSKHMTGFECLNTVIHETRHAFQIDCSKDMRMRGNDTEGISSSMNRQWQMEHTNYVSSTVDAERYYHQSIEVDARSYAAYVESTYQVFLESGL